MNILRSSSPRFSCRRSEPRRVLVLHHSESYHLMRKVLESPFEAGLRVMYRDVHTRLPPRGGIGLSHGMKTFANLY